MKPRRKYVYVVAQSYDYEGCGAPEAVYTTKKLAKAHRCTSEEVVIQCLPILNRTYDPKKDSPL